MVMGCLMMRTQGTYHEGEQGSTKTVLGLFIALSEAILIYKYRMEVLLEVKHQQKITNPVHLE